MNAYDMTVQDENPPSVYIGSMFPRKFKGHIVFSGAAFEPSMCNIIVP
jgi:hypothetical protein